VHFDCFNRLLLLCEIHPFVYSISKLDRLLLHNVVAGLFFYPPTLSFKRRFLSDSNPASAIFAPLQKRQADQSFSAVFQILTSNPIKKK
jgi:hypothetical protein